MQTPLIPPLSRPAAALAPATQSCYTSFPPLPMDDSKKSTAEQRRREEQAAQEAAQRFMEDSRRMQEATCQLAFGH